MTVRRSLPFDRLARLALYLVIGGDVLIGVLLRFRSTSKLWLDEAQSVNISAHPLSQLTQYLRHDGAPPLYYVVLHFWMRVVGSTDLDVRALSGIFGVLSLVAAYFALRAWWDSELALIALAILAVLPYAIYFGTETRMYSLVMMLSALMLWALRCHMNRPRIWTASVLAVLGALLLYTHYWSIYLLSVIGLYGLIRWWLHRQETPRRDWLLPASMAGSFILWAPWLPIFNTQRLHTGTPWAAAPTIYKLFTWFDGFTVNQSVPHVVASLHTQIAIMLFVALIIFGVFGHRMVKGSPLVVLDVTAESQSRTFAYIVFVTMAVGLLASHIDGSAYVPRYAAVIAVPICFLAARGIWNFKTSIRILLVLVLFSGASVWTDRWGIGTQRSQAGQIAAALATVPAGSIVYVCPDQLGPSLLRYSNSALNYVGYPRFVNPVIVDWYDYLHAYKIVTPAQHALQQAKLIAPTRRVFIVRAHFYGLKETCWSFEQDLAHDLNRTVVPLVKENVGGFYQPMELQELKVTTS